jgi:hypothetical protein
MYMYRQGSNVVGTRAARPDITGRIKRRMDPCTCTMTNLTISTVNYNGIVVLTELVYVDLGWLYLSSYLLRTNLAISVQSTDYSVLS